MTFAYPPVRRLLLALLAASLAPCAVPTPAEHLGFQPGTDYKLADSKQIFGYFQKLAAASDRIRFVEFGRSAMGKPMYVAFISAPENLRQLDRLREISRRMALGQPSAEEARRLAADGKAVVWIDSGLHASEVAPAQHAPELAWRMVGGETPEIQAIRRNVVLMQVPVINPDGLDWIAEWYTKNVGTPYEAAPLPWLYQRYAGHDNNRDWFMLNLQETRHVTRLLFREWFPHVVYNQHQSPPFPARIFTPPYAEPLNPNIPQEVMEGINAIGLAMRERFAREEKPGVLSYHGFDGWWNGGLRSTPAFHNMHGILTETAGNSLGTPKTYKDSDIRARFANGLPAREPTIFYQRPWMGGKWGMREAIEYMLTADFAILEYASGRRAELLLKAWRLARASIAAGEKGKPYAYVVAPDQWDASAALDMLDRLAQTGVEVRRATAAFTASGKSYPEGTYVLPAAQPFRPYLVDLMEPQRYPEIRTGSATAPIKKPYDITGWTLPMQMGVRIDRVEERFEAALKPAGQIPAVAAGTVDHRQNASFLTVAELLAKGDRVHWAADGAILAGGAAGKPAWELKKPRLALYQPFNASYDQGWTEWLLDHYKAPYTLLNPRDVKGTNLRERFDTVLLTQQSWSTILHGARSASAQRPEYTGGIGPEGAAALAKFVSEGGTLIAFDTASELPIQFFPVAARNLIAPMPEGGGEFDAPAPVSTGFYAPGSLIRITVDNTHPIGFGMPKEAIAMTTGGSAFEVSGSARKAENAVHSVARFAAKDLLASGYAANPEAIQGKHALLEAKYGKGRVVLFAFRPQFRGQTFGTFKLVLNAIYLGSARPL